jgi:hypothetical protein
MGKAHREVMYFIETKAFIQPLFGFTYIRLWAGVVLAVLNAIKQIITNR